MLSIQTLSKLNSNFLVVALSNYKQLTPTFSVVDDKFQY